MLAEFQKVRQIPRDGFRRWFSDAELDLIVWYEDESLAEILGFQLCYDKGSSQRAITWLRGRGFSHDRIDDGEVSPLRNRTPILVADGVFPKERIVRSFREAAGRIEYSLASFIAATLESYPG